MKAKKVLFVVCSSVAHGAEQVLIDTLGDRSMSESFGVLGPNIPEIQNMFEANGIHYYPSIWLKSVGAGKTKKVFSVFKKSIFWLFGSFTIIRYARNYDIIIGNNTGDCLWAPASWLAGRPFYLWVHDDLFISGLSKALKWNRRWIKAYIACSRSVERALRQLLGTDADIQCIPNGLIERPWTPKSNHVISELGWIGAMEVRKDPLLFLDIIETLGISGCTVHGQMVFKNLDNELKMKVVRSIETRRLPIKLIGQIPRDQVHEFLGRMDVLVVTSLSDPLPTVIIEAYRAGTPVIVRDIPSLREMVIEGETGLIISTESEFYWTASRISEALEKYSIGSRRLFEKDYRIEQKRQRLFNLLGFDVRS